MHHWQHIETAFVSRPSEHRPILRPQQSQGGIEFAYSRCNIVTLVERNLLKCDIQTAALLTQQNGNTWTTTDDKKTSCIAKGSNNRSAVNEVRKPNCGPLDRFLSLDNDGCVTCSDGPIENVQLIHCQLCTTSWTQFPSSAHGASVSTTQNLSEVLDTNPLHVAWF